ncbi:MAG: hypothetical protein R3F59_36740 [Myxococcota bacterium]
MERWMAGDPQFRLRGWIEAVSRCFWVAQAAEGALALPAGDPQRDRILGVLRRTYTPIVGTATVCALGAAGWVSETGYAGVTVHLWDTARGRPLTATLARPQQLVDGDPRRLLFQPVSQVTLLTVFELAHGAWELDDVRLSHDDRLSLHAGLVATPRAPRGPAAYAGVAVPDAAALVDRLAEAELDPAGFGAGVHAFLEIAGIRDVVVDDTSALCGATVLDRRGVPLSVVVPVRPERDLLVDNLARLAAEGPLPVGLFGRATLGGGRLRFEPYTAVFETPVKLAFRRPGEVQEVHLGPRAAAGVPRGGAAGPRPPARRARRPAAARREHHARRPSKPLVAGGLAWPVPGAAEALRSVRRALGGRPRRAAAAARRPGRRRRPGAGGDRAALDAAHAELQWVAGWARLARGGLAARSARARLDPQAAPQAAPDPGHDAEASCRSARCAAGAPSRSTPSTPPTARPSCWWTGCPSRPPATPSARPGPRASCRAT